MADTDWRAELREIRKRLRLSQAALGKLAGVSSAAVKTYENGTRNPTRDQLSRILDALKVERGFRNVLLEAAGFASDGLDVRPQPRTQQNFSREEAADETERYAWPSFVTDEFMEVLSANVTAQRIWGVDLRYELNGPIERNLLSVASNPRFADRCTNWDECIGMMVSIFKWHHRGAEAVESPSPYFAAVLEHFLKGDPVYVARFAKLWQEAVPPQSKMRFSYPIVWDIARYPQMRFVAFTSSANEMDGLAFNDWIPTDAQTWLALDALPADAGA